MLVPHGLSWYDVTCVELPTVHGRTKTLAAAHKMRPPAPPLLAPNGSTPRPPRRAAQAA
jgi:hypothetical protein